MKNNRYSIEIDLFHGRTALEKATLVGYGAIIEKLKPPVPFPTTLALISHKRRAYQVDGWKVFSSRNAIEDTLYKHLVFALKYEGVNLLVFKKLFDLLTEKEIIELLKLEPTGQYSRKIWFLYEWLTGKILDVPDIEIKSYVPVIDEELQYANPVSINSSRHRIKNNLPGTVNFCPLIFKTAKLEKYISDDLAHKSKMVIKDIHKDVLLRTSAFLLLKDSKASFTIEGENPSHNRAARWGRAIGQAGSKPLSKDELLRLQQIVIEDTRFVKMGFRNVGGFVGAHDRYTGEPIPDHVSARGQDLEILMSGLIDTSNKLEENYFHPVLTAAMIAFGFVFIHPFEDGNGRLHRYIIHHILASTKFTPQHIIFPVSAAILEQLVEYKKILESHSQPLLDFIEWKKTSDNNIEVLNDTIDYYRYFDATLQAEFLFDCINYTIAEIIPSEVKYLQKYDEMKNWLDDHFQMPDNTVALLIRFLEQNNG
ncbi:MAG: Fic family protein, partial [Ignavibacteria bacterium]|nr:Fic family protein [Ignavibacteria bacterium]